MWESVFSLSSVYTLALFTGTLWDIFKISLNSFLNILVCILNLSFREHAVHLLRYLQIRHSIQEIESKHNPQLTLRYRLYVLLRLVRKLQQFCLQDLQFFIPLFQQALLHADSYCRSARDLNRSKWLLSPLSLCHRVRDNHIL